MPFSILRRVFYERAASWALGFGLWTGPLAWFVNLQLNYLLVPWACATQRRWPLYVVTLAMLAVAVSAGFSAWRGWQHAAGDGGAATLAHAQFLSVLGFCTSALFFLVILAQSVPTFILHPCQP